MYLMQPREAKSTVESRVREAVAGQSDLHNVQLLVHSDSRNIHWDMAFVGIGEASATPGQPYHAASVGKTFTATLVGMLARSGQLSFDDSIRTYPPAELLDELHVYRGTDYTDEIRIRHLLGLSHCGTRQ